jgi:hypothetical protein
MGVIVFSGGHAIGATGDAHDLMQSLSRVAGGQRAQIAGRPLPTGFVDVHTDNGVVYVNPVQVAYVCDENERPAEL